jgi:hypothetical protein
MPIKGYCGKLTVCELLERKEQKKRKVSFPFSCDDVFMVGYFLGSVCGRCRAFKCQMLSSILSMTAS